MPRYLVHPHMNDLTTNSQIIEPQIAIRGAGVKLFRDHAMAFSKSKIAQREWHEEANTANDPSIIREIRPFAAFAFQNAGLVKR